jgi:hypothetical protein
MISNLSRDQLHQLARLGARARLAEIRQERAALNAILNGRTSDAGPTQTSAEPTKRRRRRRVTWTAAQRAAVSRRMRRYWAKRRQTAKKG